MVAERREQPKTQRQRQRPPTPSRQEVAHERRRHERREAGIAHVLPVVADLCGLTPEQVRGPSRGRDVALARHLVRYLMVMDGALSYSDVARRTGSDHSCVMNSCQRVQGGVEAEAGDTYIMDLLANARRVLWGLAGAPPSAYQPCPIKALPLPYSSCVGASSVPRQTAREGHHGADARGRVTRPAPLPAPTGRSTLGSVVERQEATREEWEMARYYQKRARQREREQWTGVSR